MTDLFTLATAQSAPLTKQERQARNWLLCSQRKLAMLLQRGTFKRSMAIGLLANNARDFARLSGEPYANQDLTACANKLCDWIIETATE